MFIGIWTYKSYSSFPSLRPQLGQCNNNLELIKKILSQPYMTVVVECRLEGMTETCVTNQLAMGVYLKLKYCF